MDIANLGKADRYIVFQIVAEKDIYNNHLKFEKNNSNIFRKST